jgi:hypothetical protein
MDASCSPERPPIKLRQSFPRARLRRAWNASGHGSSSGAIATTILPPLRLCRLDRTARAQRLIQPNWLESRRTISARHGGVNWKIDKSTRNQSVALPGQTGAGNLSRR